MTVKKMSINVAKASKKSRLPVSSLLPRIAIYSAVVAGIMASFYDFQLNTLSISSDREASQAKQYIASINRGQQAYYAENGQFSDDLAKLGMGLQEEIGEYRYHIRSSIGPAQYLPNRRGPAQFESTITDALTKELSIGKGYAGAVFAFKENGSNLITTIAAICESPDNRSGAVVWSPPTFDGREIHCQPGTTLVKVRP